jgi:hypothetical protein
MDRASIGHTDHTPDEDLGGTPGCQPAASQDDCDMSQIQEPKIFPIRFTKGQFMALSAPERELLIRVGLAMNDLSILQRLWLVIMLTEPKSETAQIASSTYGASLFLLIVGKVFEACEVFRKWFLSSPIAKEYLAVFNGEQLSAVERLKEILGSSSVLAKIRNSFAFHYHDAELGTYLDAIPDQQEMLNLIGDPAGNSVRSYAAEPFIASCLDVMGANSAAEALDAANSTISDAVAAFSIFATAIEVVAFRKIFPEPIEVDPSKLDPSDYQAGADIRFPAFVARPAMRSPPVGGPSEIGTAD